MRLFPTPSRATALSLVIGVLAPSAALACDEHGYSHDGAYQPITAATVSTYEETTLGSAVPAHAGTQMAYTIETVPYRPGTPCAERQKAQAQTVSAPAPSYQPVATLPPAPVVQSAPVYTQPAYHHPAPQVVEKKIYVDRPVYVERRVPVPVDRPVYVERRVPVPVDRPVYVERRVGIPVPQPVPVDRPVYVEKRVGVPVPQPVPVDRPVYVEKRIPTPVPVDRPVYVEKRIPVDRPYPVAVDRPVPVDRPVYVEKRVPHPVPVDRPVYVEKRIPVDRPYPVAVDRPVPVDRPVYVEKRVPYPVAKPVPVPVDRPVYVERRVPVPVDRPVIVERPVFPQTQIAQVPGMPLYNVGTSFGGYLPQHPAWHNPQLSPATWSTGGEVVQRFAARISRISARIAEHENRGRLTRHDAKHLRRKLQRIGNTLDKARADSVISTAEAEEIREMLRSLSAELKQRGIAAPPASFPQHGMMLPPTIGHGQQLMGQPMMGQQMMGWQPPMGWAPGGIAPASHSNWSY